MGNKLFSEVAGLTGLPSDLIHEELALLLEKKGISPDELTMDSLRSALTDYLIAVAAQMEVTGEAEAESNAAVEEAKKIALAAGFDSPPRSPRKESPQ